MNDSEIIHHAGGTTLRGSDAVYWYRAITLRTGIRMWMRSKMVPSRGLTITHMLAIAGEYTGKTYKRTQAQQAMDDLSVWIETMRAALPVTDERGQA